MATIGGLTLLEAVLYPVSILLWAYVVYTMVDLSTELWGSNYTAVVPGFLGADTLILLIVMLQPIVLLLGSALGVEATYSYALTAIQIVAGILFMRAMHNTYQIEWASTGFEAAEVNGDG